MRTLIIKNVSLEELEKQRKEVNDLIDCMPTLTTSNALMSIMSMLDSWSDERHHKALGSKENQKAQKAQGSLFTWHICPNCDKETRYRICPDCGRPTTITQFVK